MSSEASPVVTSPAGTPAAEVQVDAGMVRALLVAQHPDLADLPLWPVEAGWDNAMFRLGEDLAVRLPRRALAVPILANEQRWLPAVAGRLPLPVPAPVRTGRPGDGFPWGWSVVPWLPGVSADLTAPDPREAVRFAHFLRLLHEPAPPAAPVNPYRGVPLAERAEDVGARIDRLEHDKAVDMRAIRLVWEQALAAPLDAKPVLIHGDLHPRNILVDGGRLSAVIDWGDITGGDPATDLAAIWMLFPSDTYDGIRAAYGCATPATWERARGWAVFFGVILLDTGLTDDPRFADVGRLTLDRLAAPNTG